jgi:FAD/FMN-containing dehydrogenase
VSPSISTLITARLIAHGLPPARLGNPSDPIANTEISVRPHVLVHCFDENDVKAIVSTAQEFDVPVAVRGGGYSPAGYGTARGAIVAELSGLDEIGVTAGATVRIGGGVTAGVLDAALDEHGLALNLPIPSRAGVVGAALSGGVGVLLRTAGFISDQIVGARVVAGTGEVVDADDELLWALRGGGGNFGVVISLDLQARPLLRLHVTQIVYGEDEIAAALRHYRDASAALPDEVTAVAMVRPIPESPGILPERVGAPGLVVTLIDADTSGAGQRAEKFGAGPAALLIRSFEATPCELRAIMERGFPAARFGADVRSGWADSLGDDDLTAIERIAHAAPSPHSLFELVRLGGAVDRGHDQGAAPGRSRQFLLNAMALWTDAADGPGARAWAADAAAVVRSIRDGDAILPGFASRDESDVARTTYGAAYERLAAVKARYDPHNLFRINLAIDPAASAPVFTHKGVHEHERE